jgi:multidrug efflux pump
MNFSHFFIRRPIFAGVLSIVIFVLGLIAMWRLPISEYPEVVPPTVIVQAAYPRQSENDFETVAAPSNKPSMASTRFTCSRRPQATA